MQILQRMNKRLDIGWKLTNSNCDNCNGITMTNPNDLTQYYCPKCDKTQEFKSDVEVSVNAPSSIHYQQPEEDYFNQVIAESGIFGKPSPQSILARNDDSLVRQKQNYAPVTVPKRQQNTNNVSKKLGEKLLHGWTMLEQSCQDCNVPLMKSKKGEKICCSCEKDYAKEETEKQSKTSPTTTVPNANAQQWKKSQIQQNFVEAKQSQQPNNQVLNALVSGQVLNTTMREQGVKSQQLIENIECKALRFLQFKMDKAIDENDISAVEKILAIIKGMK